MPNKKEIKLLQYLYKTTNRSGGNKYEELENIKKNLLLSDNDLSDMRGSPFLYFTGPGIIISNQGNNFVENYRYEKTKEIFYWIFGLSSIIAAIFAVWAVLK